MAGALQTGLPSDTEPAVGMSDEVELQRAGLDGIGEVLYDQADEFELAALRT